ncbi:hypothetical protein E4U52_004134 [Claviceps spartinae]|nr:hypothetical protein E4U52_004134 [Claviceps spartinae]
MGDPYQGAYDDAGGADLAGSDHVPQRINFYTDSDTQHREDRHRMEKRNKDVARAEAAMRLHTEVLSTALTTPAEVDEYALELPTSQPQKDPDHTLVERENPGSGQNRPKSPETLDNTKNGGALAPT